MSRGFAAKDADLLLEGQFNAHPQRYVEKAVHNTMKLTSADAVIACCKLLCRSFCAQSAPASPCWKHLPQCNALCPLGLQYQHRHVQLGSSIALLHPLLLQPLLAVTRQLLPSWGCCPEVCMVAAFGDLSEAGAAGREPTQFGTRRRVHARPTTAPGWTSSWQPVRRLQQRTGLPLAALQVKTRLLLAGLQMKLGLLPAALLLRLLKLQTRLQQDRQLLPPAVHTLPLQA